MSLRAPLLLALLAITCSLLLWPEEKIVRESFRDTGAGGAVETWGGAACAERERIDRLPRGGDPHPTALGSPQPGGEYRLLRVLDGDDADGERCELGQNDHRVSPTALYEEGEARSTYFSLRLRRSFPLYIRTWQVVMQMKQSQPSAGGSGPPVLALHVERGRWRLMQAVRAIGPHTRELWSAPARRGVWTRFAITVSYSAERGDGTVLVRADLDGDGSFGGRNERSRLIRARTLKIEPPGRGEDGIDAGASIPSHLRVGIYHDPAIDCPPPRGCAIEVDNVQVITPPNR